ncbi:protein kintoun [Anastrepha obliqua]|uniref:protein kintoun n=1 Tax=Anastrepha obliqua TaxID=95512 RepID=UPI00240A7518|nr:protein kintoun [Anastrepha obliqua]XP_054737493.1 protein kintoun [Anastrepha obliqua]XP_054737494.1 protein kintoun [Anastrepha obliqua]
MSEATATQKSVRNKLCPPPPRRNSNSGGGGGSEYLDITKEEFSRIEDALKKEEFRKLFFEYCEEIQDPENRKLYEQEIKQFEAERGVDVRFINPEPGFVIKTSADGVTKCFINVAKSAEVARPTNEVCLHPETGNRGLSWAIPLAQAPPREDLDAHGKRCRVYDVIFHPDALYLSQRDTAFRKCLIDTALDAVEREFKIKLDRTNLKFPKLLFKGMARPIVIRKLSKNAPPEATEPHPLDSISPERPSAFEDKPKLIPMNTKKSFPEFNTPKYVIKHRRDVDLSEYTYELDAKLSVTIPRELVVEIELPLLKSTSDCKLDVTAKSLYLLSDRPGAKYRLNLDLPHAVDDKCGQARFDTDSRRLTITLPVVQNNPDKQRILHDSLFQLNREDSGVESDIREDGNLNSNGESPVEELSGLVEESTNISGNNVNSPAPQFSAPAIAPTLPSPANAPNHFLKSSIQYHLPAKFDCNVLDNVMSLVLHVRNVQPESIAMLKGSKSIHLQFISIGSGYYPVHYAFYLRLPEDSNAEISSADAEAWENNVVLNLNLAASCENIQNYLVGIEASDLKEYTIQGKFQLGHKSRQSRKKSPPTPPISLSSSLDISVERSECERSVEIEIKPSNETQSTCTANTTEDEDVLLHATGTAPKKMNKKQKKKNKKRRSLSESVCDDIKVYQKQQQQQQQEHQKQFLKEAAKILNNESSNSPDDNSSPERTDKIMPSSQTQTTTSQSMAVPNTVQQRKQRSYSECRSGDSVVSSGGSTLPPSFKGILKRYSRYEPRPSISDSCSSIDECSSFSCSVDGGVGSSLRFSQSFSDIPEENVSNGLSESCKKTVRFNEVIKEQVFRLNSSILGQRKKNQKRRDRKQRALQRRLSEGDSADYEDNSKPIGLDPDVQYFKSKSSGDDNTGNSTFKPPYAGGKHAAKCTANKQQHNAKYGTKLPRARLESEESSDADAHKNAMMFEMDM